MLGDVFNLSGSEIIVILLLALVVLGPEKLPEAMRRAGRTFAELKKLSSGFQDEVRKGFDEPVKEVKRTASAVRSAASFTGADTTGVKDKPRYNPAVDPRPEPPEGSSVAEAAVPEPVVENVADDSPIDPADTLDPPAGAGSEPPAAPADDAAGVDEAAAADEAAVEADRST